MGSPYITERELDSLLVSAEGALEKRIVEVFVDQKENNKMLPFLVLCAIIYVGDAADTACLSTVTTASGSKAPSIIPSCCHSKSGAHKPFLCRYNLLG